MARERQAQDAERKNEELALLLRSALLSARVQLDPNPTNRARLQFFLTLPDQTSVQDAAPRPLTSPEGAVIGGSNTLQLFQLLLKPLLETTLHQVAKVLHQGVGHRIDQPRAVPLTTHQPRPLQLAQLAAYGGLAEAGGLDQGGHIHGAAVLELAEQLQASRFAQQAEEGAEFIEQLGTRQGLGQGLGRCPVHGRAYVDTRIMHAVRRLWT
jgi:hypothetical protein